MIEHDHKYVRDTVSNAVINTDVEGLRRYKAQKKHLREMSNVKDDLDILKNEFAEIKSLLKALINA
jgi:hypothetical protein